MSVQKYKEKRKRKQKRGAYRGCVKGRKTIRLPLSPQEYDAILNDPSAFRQMLEEQRLAHEELFPKGIDQGYSLHSKEYSKKLDFTYRRIQLKTGATYGIVPGFVMPYMVGYTADLELPLLFKKYGLPNWLLSRAFGHNDMYWDRLENSLGRPSIVGTTVKDVSCLPTDYACDEKFTRWGKTRAYIAMTAAKECVLGMSVSLQETAKAFGKAYGVFVKEARNIQPKFRVNSVNLDGFHASRKAWKTMFKEAVVILCFLHGVLKISRAAKRNCPLFKPLMDRVWEVYHSSCSQDFLDQMEQLKAWTEDNVEQEKVKMQVNKLYNRSLEYDKAYQVQHGHRTSNMVDRQMDAFDRFIYNRKYYHGHMTTTELKVRAWAILHNFAPFCARKKIDQQDGHLLYCRAAQLNGFTYSQNWLENLICSASMNGIRQ